MTDQQIKAARRSNLLMYLFSGLSISTWAPMIPFAKVRMHLNEADLGMVIFMTGCGSMVMMPLSAVVANRLGTRTITVIAAALITALLPLLAVVSHPWILGACLFVLGASMGASGVARNSQAVIVERYVGRPIMSSFHAFFSLGCLAGSLMMSLLLHLGWSLIACASVMAAIVGIIALTNCSDLLPHSEDRKLAGAKFALPRRGVLFLGLLCFITYLSEGTVLDWGAVYLRFSRGFAPAQAGLGFAAFAVAMATGRLCGDFITHRIGRERIMLFGGLLASAGYLTVILVPFAPVALVGFVMIGAGLSNVVPVLISASGRVPNVPPAVSIATVSTVAAVGLLSGPALIGFVGNVFGLSTAFAGLAALLLVLAFGRRAVR
ncbi:MAG: MFS transporter [Chthoniobacterales bacterium]